MAYRPLTLSLDEETDAALTATAAVNRLSRSALARLALVQLFAKPDLILVPSRRIATSEDAHENADADAAATL